MASGSLAYRPHQDLDTDLTKFGFLVYAGTIRDFHEWEFRAMTRWKQTKVGERSELASKFLDSLRSEAYIIAEDLGTDILLFERQHPQGRRSSEGETVSLSGTGIQGAVPAGDAGRWHAVTSSWRAYGVLHRRKTTLASQAATTRQGHTHKRGRFDRPAPRQLGA